MGCAPCELGSVEHRAGIHPVRSVSWPSTRTGSEFCVHQPNKEYLFNSSTYRTSQANGGSG